MPQVKQSFFAEALKKQIVKGTWDDLNESERYIAWYTAVRLLLAKQADGDDVRVPAQVLSDLVDAWRSLAGSYQDRGLEVLFDFSIGPASFQRGELRQRPGRLWVSRDQMSPPGLPVDQDVFLDEFWQRLDDFALEVTHGRANGETADGVHILCGPRGSGKSTALNRIQWFCNNWFKPNITRPTLVRFDLGTTFDAKPFTLNLMSEICRAVRLHVRQEPKAWHWSHLNWARHLVGRVGRWCESNLTWVLLLMVLGGMFSAIANLQTIGPIDEKTAVVARGVFVLTASVLLVGLSYKWGGKWAENNPDNPWDWSPLCIVLTLVIPLIGFGALVWGEYHSVKGSKWLPIVRHSTPHLFGVPDPTRAAARAAAVAEIINRSAADDAKRAGRTGAETKPILTTRPTTTEEAVTLEQAIQAEADSLWEKEKQADDSPTAVERGHRRFVTAGVPLLILWLVFVISFAVAIFLLPRWWWSYAYCLSLTEALRARQSQDAMPELPYFATITTAVRALLPQPTGSTEIRELDTPFLHEQLKQLLRRCAADFDGLVVLIDDVDLLPSEKFAELFQVLRPMSKEAGVRCIVCVPLYFYYAVKAPLLSDLHSTVQEVRLVGDRRMEASAASGVFRTLLTRTPATTAVSDLQKRVEAIIEALMKSRCRVRPKDEVAQSMLSPMIDWFCTRWDLIGDVSIAGRVAKVLREIGPSRREILRETRRLLKDSRRRPFDDRSSQYDEQNEERLERYRAEYRNSESILNVRPRGE